MKQRKKAGRTATAEHPYPSLLEGPTPAERLAKVLKGAEANGRRPMTEEDFEELMRGPSPWPEEDDIDEFIAWLRESRRKGRYE